MKKVNINLFQERKAHRLLGLSLYDYEGAKELQKLILVIEDTLKKNFPGVQVNRNKAAREFFQEGGGEGQ